MLIYDIKPPANIIKAVTSNNNETNYEAQRVIDLKNNAYLKIKRLSEESGKVRFEALFGDNAILREYQ